MKKKVREFALDLVKTADRFSHMYFLCAQVVIEAFLGSDEKE